MRRTTVTLILGLILGLAGVVLFEHLGKVRSTAGASTGLPPQQQFTVSINSIEVIEGDQGTTNAVLTVRLSEATFFTIRVGYATADNTAIATSDYTPASGTVTFPPGATTATISIAILGDSLVEPPETFFVLLRNPSPAEYVAIGSGAGTCTIISNDTKPAGLYVSNTDVIEGQSGDENAVFRVEMSPPSLFDVSFSYATEDLGAVAGRDYQRRTGTLTIPARAESVNIVVPIIDDTVPEVQQRFLVRLSDARAAVIQDGEAECVIIDNDNPTSVRVCSGDTPKTDNDTNRIASTVTINQDVVIDDLEVQLFVRNSKSLRHRITGDLKHERDGAPIGYADVFQDLLLPGRSSIGTTCAPAPDFVIKDGATRRLQDYKGEAPYVGSWRTSPDPLTSIHNLGGARGQWELRVQSDGTTGFVLECWCLAVTGPREGLRVEPLFASAPVFQGLDDGDDRSDGDIGSHTVVASLASSSGPSRNLPVTFTVRDKGGQGDVILTETIPTDERGRAKFEYLNWVPGEHTIDAQASVDGATYTNRARVTWINSCASTAALQGTPDADTTLNAMRRFRDSKLAKSSKGRNYSRLYYAHSSELVRMMMFNPMMVVRSQEMIERYMPAVRDLTEGHEIVLSEGDIEDIDDFLSYLGTNASSRLKETITGLRDDLRNSEVRREFGVKITPGPIRNLRSQERLQHLNRIGGLMMLAGSVVILGRWIRRHPRRSVKRSRSFFCVAIALLITAPNLSGPWRDRSRSPSLTTEQYRKSPTAGQALRPVSFEANQGRADPAVKFISRGPEYTMLLGTGEASFVFHREPDANHNTRSSSKAGSLRMKMLDSNPDVRISGIDGRPGGTNYYVGDDKSNWRSQVPTFEKVKYENLYSGVDMIYYGGREGLEYDLIVAPEADPSRIKFVIEGSETISVDGDAGLLIETSNAGLRHHRPVAYQEIAGERTVIPARYKIQNVVSGPSHTPIVSFEIGDYDRSKPLIIDPVLEFSSYLGGTGDDQGTSLVVDAAGNIYIVGITDSIDLLASNAAQPAFGGVQDTFVAKLDPTGTRILYLTYLGGSDLDGANGLAIDSAGNAYITGYTRSRNFPLMSPLQPSNRGQFNSFVTKLGPAGNLVYSTYLGGTASDTGCDIVVDAAGNAHVAGITTSSNFPTSNPLQSSLRGAGDLYVAKLNAAGNQLMFSTYLGGSMDDAPTGIALDSSGSMYVTGATLSPDFRTANAAQPSHGGGIFDGFVLKLNSQGNQLVYSTYLGGNGGDRTFRVTADAAGNAYVIGDTRSTNMTSTGSLQRTLAGGSDAFVAKFGPNGSLVYSTYLGGAGIDSGTAIALDQSGAAYVTGFTSSADFPTVSAVQPAQVNGSVDAFVAKLTPSGSSLEYSTFLGGSGLDSGWAIAVGASNKAYVVGVTTSTDFPTVTPLQTANRGGPSDLFVASIRPGPGVSSAAIEGKHLLITGAGFDEGAVILLNGEQQKTIYLSRSSLRGKKVGKRIGPGQTVQLHVRNPDGILSNTFAFTRLP